MPVSVLCITGNTLIMKDTEVPNPRHSSACDCTCVLTRIDHCLVNNRSCHACQMCLVLFLPVQSLLMCFRSSLTRFADRLSLSFPTNNPSSDSKAFLRFIAFSGSPTAVHCAFLSSMRRHGHSRHKLISSRAQRYYTVHIPFSDA